MRNIRIIAFALATLFVGAPLGFAQAAPTHANLAAAITRKDAMVVALTSTTGITARTTQIYVDKELMDVNVVISTTALSVRRGAGGTLATTHASGALVVAAPGNYFTSFERSGSCTAGNEEILPVINVKTGDHYDCLLGVWEKAQQINVATVSQSRRVAHHVVELNYAGSTTLGSLSAVGDRGLAQVSSGTTITAGYIYGTEGKARVNGTLNGSAWVFGNIGQLDISNATLTAGSHIGAIWGDAGATGPSASIAFADLMVLTNTTATTFNSLIYGYGKASYFADLSNNGSGFIVATAKGSGWDKSLKIKINGTDYYIPLNPAAQ